MGMNALFQVPADLIEMIGRGVSVHVSSRDERQRPSVMRSVGSDIDPARGAHRCRLAVLLAQ
jgi:hypothetical protein